MLQLIPRPMRDILEKPFGGEPLVQHTENIQLTQSQNGFLSILGKMRNAFPSDRVVRAALRIAIAASGILIFTGAAKETIILLAVVGSVVSLPSLAIAAGAYLLCHGVSLLIVAVAQASFSSIAFISLNIAAGLMALEFHDAVSLGIMI